MKKVILTTALAALYFGSIAQTTHSGKNGIVSDTTKKKSQPKKGSDSSSIMLDSGKKMKM